MNWQDAIKDIFLIFAGAAADKPMPVEQQKEVARLWFRHVERHARGYFARKGVPWHEAEDLAQEVILKLFRARTLADVDYPRAYYYRILHNLFTDFLRQLRPGWTPPDESQASPSGDDPEDEGGMRYPTQGQRGEETRHGADPYEPVDPALGPDGLADIRLMLRRYERDFPARHQRLALWVAGLSAREIASVEHDIPVDAVTERHAGNMAQSISATVKHFRAQQEQRT